MRKRKRPTTLAEAQRRLLDQLEQMRPKPGVRISSVELKIPGAGGVRYETDGSSTRLCPHGEPVAECEECRP